MPYTIAVLPGDGIGPEVVAEGVKVLRAVGERAGRDFELLWGVVGGAAIDQYGTALPPETAALCARAATILAVACGARKWDDPRALLRPGDALFGLRYGFVLFSQQCAVSGRLISTGRPCRRRHMHSVSGPMLSW